MKLFEIWMDPEHSEQEERTFSFFCLAGTPAEAIMMGALDPDGVDWITQENLGCIVIMQFNLDPASTHYGTRAVWSYNTQYKRWDIGELIPLPAEVIPVDLEKVTKWIDDIADTTNWVSDNYVLNFCDNLTDPEKYNLMLRLANYEMLFEEEKLPDGYDSAFVPDMGAIWPEAVIEQYQHLIHPNNGNTQN